MNQKGQQSLQNNETNEQLQTQHHTLNKEERKKTQQNEKMLNEQLHSLQLQKKEQVQNNNQEFQRQFINQQQQQAFQESMPEVHQQYKNTNESQNYQQGGGPFHIGSQGQFIGDRENQVSVSLISTGQIQEDHNRFSLSTRSVVDANYQSTHNISQMNTLPVIQSLKNISSSTDRIDNISQQLDVQNKNQSKNLSDQSMGHSSNNLNQIFTQNNINNNNNTNNVTNNINFNSNSLIGTVNPAISVNDSNISANSINYNFPLNQPVQFQSNQQAVLNPAALQQTPINPQISYLGQQQIPQINASIIGYQLPQISNNTQFMCSQIIQPQGSFLVQPNYNFVQIPNQNLVIQQQPQQQHHPQQQQQGMFSNQNLNANHKQSTVNQAFNQQIANNMQAHAQQQYMQQVNQQQQLINQQRNNLNSSYFYQNAVRPQYQEQQSIAKNHTQALPASQQRVTLQNNINFTHQPNNAAVLNNALGFPQQNSSYQTGIPQKCTQNTIERKNLQESFSSSSNFPTFQQNTAISEKLRCISEQMNENENIPSNLNQTVNSVLQSNEVCNLQKNFNQGDSQQINQKIKQEEDNYQSSSTHNKFINQGKNQLQKFSDTQAAFLQSCQQESNSQTRQSMKQLQNTVKYDSIQQVEDTIQEKNFDSIVTSQEQKRPRDKKNKISCEQVSNQSAQQLFTNTKNKRKARVFEETLASDSIIGERKLELASDDKSQGLSQSSVLSVKQTEGQIKIQQQIKQGVNSPTNLNITFLDKKIEKKYQIQTQMAIEEQFQSSQKDNRKDIELAKTEETLGQTGYKKMKTQQSDLNRNQVQVQALYSNSAEMANQIEIVNEKPQKIRSQEQQQKIPQQSYGQYCNYTNIPQVQVGEIRSHQQQQLNKDVQSQYQGQCKTLSGLFDQSEQTTKPQFQNKFQQKNLNENQFFVNENDNLTHELEIEYQGKQSKQQQNQFFKVQTDSSPIIERAAGNNIQNNTTKNLHQQSYQNNKINLSQGIIDSQITQNSQIINISDQSLQFMQPNQIIAHDQNEQLNDEQNFQKLQGNIQTQNLKNREQEEPAAFSTDNKQQNFFNILNGQVSLFSFLIDSVQCNLDINQKQYESLNQTLDLQSQLLIDTVQSVRNIRQDVDDMILHSQDIQGQSGLIDFMRGRLKEYVRSRPDMLLDYDDSILDSQTSFYSKYELVLKEGNFSEPLIKDKNFIIDVSLIDSISKRVVCNLEPIPVRLRMYNYNNPPIIFESDYIKGVLGQDLLNGSCTFKKIHIKQVTSHQKQKSMFIVIEPDIESMYGLPPLKLNKQPITRSDPTDLRGLNQLKQLNESDGGQKLEVYSLEEQLKVKQELIENYVQEGYGSSVCKIQKNCQLSKQQSTSSQEKPLKKKVSRIKKIKNDKKNDINKQECDIIQHKINPILIKPLILEQIIVKSKNNLSSRA